MKGWMYGRKKQTYVWKERKIYVWKEKVDVWMYVWKEMADVWKCEGPGLQMGQNIYIDM
jgi:hypothetical protein